MKAHPVPLNFSPRFSQNPSPPEEKRPPVRVNAEDIRRAKNLRRVERIKEQRELEEAIRDEFADE